MGCDSTLASYTGRKTLWTDFQEKEEMRAETILLRLFGLWKTLWEGGPGAGEGGEPPGVSTGADP